MHKVNIGSEFKVISMKTFQVIYSNPFRSLSCINPPKNAEWNNLPPWLWYK